MENVEDNTPASAVPEAAAVVPDAADETDPAKNKNDHPTPPPPAAVPAPAPATNPPPENAVEGAKKEVQKLVDHHELDENDSSALQKVFKENEALKDKVSKLKALLGRSGEFCSDMGDYGS